MLEEAKLIETRIRVKKDYIKSFDDFVEEHGKIIPRKRLEDRIKPYRSEAVGDLDVLERQYSSIMKALELVEDPTLKQILTLRYIEGKKIKIIAKELFFSEQWVHVLLNRGLDEYKIRKRS